MEELLKEREKQSPSPFRHNRGCCPSSRNAAELPSPLRRGFPKRQQYHAAGRFLAAFPLEKGECW